MYLQLWIEINMNIAMMPVKKTLDGKESSLPLRIITLMAAPKRHT